MVDFLDLLADIVTFMDGLEPMWLYLFVFVIAYLENVVPPLPGDMVIVFAGYLVGLGHIGFLPVLVLATLGGTAGFMTMFAVGWKVGGAVFDVDRMRWVPKRAAARALVWLRRYGYFVVAANRFLSGARSAISLAVGAARMEPARTSVWATFSSGLWCLLIVSLGYLLGDQWPIIGEYLRLYGQWVLGLLILTLIAYILLRTVRTRWPRRPRRSSEDPVGSRSGTPRH